MRANKILKRIGQGIAFIISLLVLGACMMPAPGLPRVSSLRPTQGLEETAVFSASPEASLEETAFALASPVVSEAATETPGIVATSPAATATRTPVVALAPQPTKAPTATVPPKPTSTSTLPPDATIPSPTAQVTQSVEALSATSPLTLTHFALQPGSPAALQYFARTEVGCNWSGVAGQVFSPSGAPMNGLVVEVSGNLNGKEVLKLVLSGSAPVYGPGGYEIMLADKAIASTSPLFIQLYDLNGKELSAQIPFDTYAACDKNLILINFIEAGNLTSAFLPLTIQKESREGPDARGPMLFMPVIQR